MGQRHPIRVALAFAVQADAVAFQLVEADFDDPAGLVHTDQMGFGAAEVNVDFRAFDAEQCA